MLFFCQKFDFWKPKYAILHSFRAGLDIDGVADVCPRAREGYLLTTSLVMCWTSAPVSTSSFFIDAMAM